jgi:SP family general alpha glucoside:H+ symporter-like MFS transporter
LTQLGAMTGAAAAGPLLDRFGRRAATIIGAIICAIAITIMYLSDHVSTLEGRRGTFLAGKLILGLSLGLFQVTATTYISEIAPPRIRGPLLSTSAFVLILGQLIAAAIVGALIVIPKASSYRVALASQWAFAGWALLVGIVIPESPAYYLKRGNETTARKVFNRLHKPEYVEANLQALAATLEHERLVSQASRDASFKECFKGTNFRRSRIVLFMNVVQQALGVTFIANSTYFLILAGLAPANSINVLIIGLSCALCANVASWFLMTTIGRRKMIMINTTIVAVMWTTIAIAGFYQSSQTALW